MDGRGVVWTKKCMQWRGWARPRVMRIMAAALLSSTAVSAQAVDRAPQVRTTANFDATSGRGTSATFQYTGGTRINARFDAGGNYYFAEMAQAAASTFSTVPTGSGPNQVGAIGGVTNAMLTAPANTSTLALRGHALYRICPAPGTVDAGTYCSIGTLTLTFSEPITNPVLHVSGMGVLENVDPARTRSATAFTLPGSASAQVLSGGTSRITVVGNRIQASSPYSSVANSCVATPTAAACGSVRIVGTFGPAQPLVLEIGVLGWAPTASTPYGSGDDFVYNEAALVSATITVNADITVSKTTADGNNRYIAGGTGEFLVKVDSAATSNSVLGVQISDLLPAGVTLNGAVQCSVSNPGTQYAVTTACGAVTTSGSDVTLANADFAPGGELTLRIPVRYATTLTGTITNTATAVLPSGWSDPTPANNSSSVSLTRTQSALSVSKTSAQSTVVSGQSVQYTITVANAGPDPAPAGSVVRDVPVRGITCDPAAAVTCTSATGACPSAQFPMSSLLAGIAMPAIPLSGSAQFSFTCIVN